MGLMDFFRSKAPAKHTPKRRRNYSAAQSVARYGDFRPTSGSADYELRDSIVALRNKSRFLARNSSSMARFINLMRVNVVGDNGFRFQSRVRKGDGTMDTGLNERVERAWRRWAKQPTVDGQMTFNDLCEQAVSTWCRDGEVIWEIVVNGKYRDGVAINPIEADLLDETLNGEYPKTGNEIRMGVEIDAYGRPVAYHFLHVHPGDLTWFSRKPESRHRRVPAERVIHMFIRLRPGQSRGEPPAVTTINSVKMLDGYREAEVTNRRVAAAMMGFFRRDLPKAENISELADQVSPDEEHFEVDVVPGTFKQLPDGMAFETFNPSGSATDYEKFEGQVKKDISMGLNISAFSLGMETAGVSYSTGRSVLIEDRDYYRLMQRFFIEHGAEKVFGKWVPYHMLSDGSSIPPTRRDVVMDDHVFRPRGWDWVDPAKDVRANTEALRTGQTSLARVAAQRGIDRDELLDEIAEDQAAADARGLTLVYDGDIPLDEDMDEDGDNAEG